MAVPKATRFQVLKRDGHRCQYCGASAPDVKLTVDHAIPSALGGDDKPSNLVAACVDCNAGKGASNPDNDLVERLSAESATYALAMANKTAAIVQRLKDERAYADRFFAHWEATAPVPPYTLDADWRASVRRWHAQGVPIELLEYGIDVAAEKEKRGGLSLDGVFRYMAGVVYTTLKQEDVSFTLGDKKMRLYTEDEKHDAFMRGLDRGDFAATMRAVGTDLLARHIDRGARAEDDIYTYMVWDGALAHLEAAA